MATEFISQKNPGGIHTKNSFRKAWNSYFLAICGHLPTSCPFIFEKVGSKYEQIVNKTDKITPHMLRHTFCTMMHENWVDIKTAQQQMGHSDTKTTMNVYTHVTSQFEAKEMQKKWTFWPKFIQKSYKMGQKPRKIADVTCVIEFAFPLKPVYNDKVFTGGVYFFDGRDDKRIHKLFT